MLGRKTDTLFPMVFVADSLFHNYFAWKAALSKKPQEWNVNTSEDLKWWYIPPFCVEFDLERFFLILRNKMELRQVAHSCRQLKLARSGGHPSTTHWQGRAKSLLPTTGMRWDNSETVMKGGYELSRAFGNSGMTHDGKKEQQQRHSIIWGCAPLESRGYRFLAGIIYHISVDFYTRSHSAPWVHNDAFTRIVGDIC